MGWRFTGPNIFNYFYDFVLYSSTERVCDDYHGGIWGKYQIKRTYENVRREVSLRKEEILKKFVGYLIRVRFR